MKKDIRNQKRKKKLKGKERINYLIKIKEAYEKYEQTK